VAYPSNLIPVHLAKHILPLLGHIYRLKGISYGIISTKDPVLKEDPILPRERTRVFFIMSVHISTRQGIISER
jgi:hypothetical protein